MSRPVRGFSRNGSRILVKNDFIEPVAFDLRYIEQSNRVFQKRKAVVPDNPGKAYDSKVSLNAFREAGAAKKRNIERAKEEQKQMEAILRGSGNQAQTIKPAKHGAFGKSDAQTSLSEALNVKNRVSGRNKQADRDMKQLIWYEQRKRVPADRRGLTKAMAQRLNFRLPNAAQGPAAQARQQEALQRKQEAEKQRMKIAKRQQGGTGAGRSIFGMGVQEPVVKPGRSRRPGTYHTVDVPLW